MVEKKGFGARGLIVRTVLAVVTLTIGLGLTGCGEQMARIEENQLRLQAMVEANAQQVAALSARVEQNQYELQAGIGDVQSSTKGVAADMAAVENRQLSLQEMVQNENQQLANTMAAVQQDLYALQTGIENVQYGAGQMAVEIASVGDEQMKVQEMVQNNSEQLTGQMVSIQQNQSEWQGRIEQVQANVQRATAGITALEESLSRLQNILQDNMREFLSIIKVAGQDQLKVQQGIEGDLRALTDSVGAIKQDQAELDKRITDVQSDTEIIRNDVPAAIEQLKAELSATVTAEAIEMAATKPFPPPSETNSVDLN